MTLKMTGNAAVIVKLNMAAIVVLFICPVCDNAAMKRCPAQYWKKKKIIIGIILQDESNLNEMEI